MAVVERADSDVVVLVGVPLATMGRQRHLHGNRDRYTYGISLGVSGLDGVWGRLMIMGAVCVCCDMLLFWCLGWQASNVWW